MDTPIQAAIPLPLTPSPELRAADPQFAAMCDIVRQQGEIIATYRALVRGKDKIIDELYARLAGREEAA
jgi:hypothetical protein